MRLAGDTDVSKSKPAIFQFRFAEGTSQHEKESAKQVVLKNDTATGEVQLEGSIKQLRKLLRQHLVVKPPCLLDKSIRLYAKVSYALNGQYSDGRSRDVQMDMSQIRKAGPRQEYDHFYKYRFLYQDEQGNIQALYDKTQDITGGAGDLLLKFRGMPGSGFEFCEETTQSLTRGSQY